MTRTPSTEYYRNISVELPDRDTLVSACQKEFKARDRQTNKLIWPSDSDPRFFVKFGGGIDPSEGRNQIYFHKMTANSRSIQIAEVYWIFFEGTTGMTYIVMEFIRGCGEVSDEEMARALVELLSVPSPEDAAPGPIGGGKLHYQLFRHGVAPVEFGDNEQLGQYITYASHFLELFFR